MPAIGAPGEQATLSNTAAAVLGMVALGARSGYDVRRAAERSLRFFWALGAPQIYAQLKHLEKSGLIAGRDDARGERARRVFTVTAAGEAAMRTWIAAPDAAGALELRDPELLRLFFADAAGPADALASIGRMRRRSDRSLELFRSEILPAAARTTQSGAAFPERVAAFGVELHEFIRDWCRRLERELADEGAG